MEYDHWLFCYTYLMVDNGAVERPTLQESSPIQKALLTVRKTFKENLRGKKLEQIPFSTEQLGILDNINQTAIKILSEIGIGNYPDPKYTILYRATPTTDDQKVSHHSIYDPTLDAISIPDRDIQNEQGEYSNNLLALIYSHELAHHYGLPHKKRGNKISEGFRPPLAEPYRGMAWFNETSAIHLAAAIRHAAGFSTSPNPQPEDWSDKPTEFKDCFEALTANISKYLNYEENKHLLERLSNSLSPLDFRLQSADVATIKRFLIYARVNRQAHDELVFILKTAYSKKPHSYGEAYTDMWDQLCDDIGLFIPIRTKPQDLEL